jgi:phosphatidylserine decarboxylase
LPIWFRPYGFQFYAFVFGCNLDEIEHADLTHYASLGDFFYRKLKEGVRPVDNAALVSPADGKVLHFGTIKDLRVEQVKGITYSLDALLGVEMHIPGTPSSTATVVKLPPDHSVVDDQEFANVNGIEYSLDQLLGTSEPTTPGSSTPTSDSPSSSPLKTDADHPHPTKHGEQIDASVEQEGTVADTLAHEASVAFEMGVRSSFGDRRRSTSGTTVKEGNSLFFAVIYLAPGDYHRFHSPTAWVVEKRRHFMGELFSVSPYMAKRLENLFVLNERVALLGRWKYGFFGMVPVGATNVGSIKINFDTALRTNIRGRRPPPGTYTEGIYTSASTVLHGQPLRPGEEMGGFCLGSTIVLVFEAPKTFEFKVQAGQKVKVGQRLGDVVEKQKTE